MRRSTVLVSGLCALVCSLGAVPAEAGAVPANDSLLAAARSRGLHLTTPSHWTRGGPTAGIHADATPSITISDPTNDAVDAQTGSALGGATDARGDIIAGSAGVDAHSFVLRTHVANPTDPETDANWSNAGTFAAWPLDTNFDGHPDRVVFMFVNSQDSGHLDVGLFDPGLTKVFCIGTAVLFAGTVLQASFGSSCPHLGAFQWDAQVQYDAGGSAQFDFAPNNPPAPPTPASRSGYFMLGADGKTYGFGNGPNFGGTVPFASAFAPLTDGTGLFVTDLAGHVFTRGRAHYHGGSPSLHGGEQITTIAATPSGGGYWLFSNQGRVFHFGNAGSFGDESSHVLNGPIIAAVATPDGGGYYMVGSDGGIFTHGNAKFHGSEGGKHLNAPIVGIAPTPDGHGYWLVGSDGGVFTFGTATFRGSTGSEHLNAPVNGMVAYGNGYLLVASDGGVFDFSNKAFQGSLGGTHLSAPIIAIVAFSFAIV